MTRFRPATIHLEDDEIHADFANVRDSGWVFYHVDGESSLIPARRVERIEFVDEEVRG